MSKVLHFYSLNLWQTCLGKNVLRQIITGRGVYCAARRGSHAEWIAPTGRVLVIRSFNQCTGLVVRWRLTRRSLCSAQVWFQNARAKEKKFKINIGKPFMISQGSPEGPRPECTLCCVKYTARMSVRDHIFSKQHIAKVQETLGNQVDREKDYLAPTTVRQLMAQQELDRMKKVGDGLTLPGQQKQMTVDNNNALHGLSLPSSYPGISGLPPVLLPGVNGPSSLPVFPPNTPGELV